MKSLILTLLCFFLSAVSMLLAQDTTAMEVKIEEMVTQLPRSEITSGIFYEQVPTYVPYEYFDGHNLGDSIYLGPERFGLVYKMLYHSHQSSPSDPEPSEVDDLIKAHEGNEVVHLGALYYHYHKVKEDAQSNDWLDWDGTYFYDQSPSNISLYEEKTLWAASALTAYAEGADVSFALDPDLFFTNQSIDWNTLEVNVQDGQGWQSINQNQILNASYTHLDSVYLIQMRMKNGQDDWMQAQTPVMVYATGPKGMKMFQNKPDGVIRLGETDFFPLSTPCCDLSGNRERLQSLCKERRVVPDHLVKNEVVKNGVEIFYWLNESSCEAPCHRKPLIIVEGFDPNEDYGYKIVFDEYNDEQGLLNSRYEMNDLLNTYVHEEGYDVYFINFGYENNTQSIEDNAEWLKMAINEINDLKADCSSVEQNVVIGASMGGLVSRWALSDMEEDGQDHETELFISFDSPLKGANVPIGYQGFVKGLAGTKIFGKPLRNNNTKLRHGEWTLQTPAAKEMLIYNRFASSNRETTASTLSSFYETFQDKFSQKELSIPHLALSNGSVLNEGQGFSNSEVLLDKVESIPYIFELQLYIAKRISGINSCNPLSDRDMEMINYWKKEAAFNGSEVVGVKVKMYAAPGQAKLYSSGTVYEKWFAQTFLGVSIWGNYSYFAATGLQDLDNAPGATSNFNSEDGENEMFEIAYDKYCFIPTASSLGIPLWPNLKTDLSDVSQVVENNPTPALTFRGAVMPNEPGSTNTNQKHISLDPNSALWWRYQTEKVVFDGWETEEPFELTDIYHIGEGPVHMPPNMDVFNFMARRCENMIENDLTIQDGGEFWIGRDANLGIVPTPGNPENEAPVTKVWIAKNKCNEFRPTVIVKPESALRMGGNNASGELFLTKDTDMMLEADALLQLNHQSKVFVGSGATLDLSSMSNMTLDNNSELIVDSGGKLIVGEFTELSASTHSRIIVESGGIVEVAPNAKIDLDQHAELIVKEGGELILPADAELFVNSFSTIDMQENSVMRLETDAILKIDKLSIVLISPTATLYIEENTSITIDGGSKIDLKGGYVMEGNTTIQAPNGFIDIHHSMTLNRSIEGNLSIFGSQKNRRILKLRKHVRLNMSTFDLTLQDGKVEIGSGFSSIRSSTWDANSTFSLKNVKIAGTKPVLAVTDPYIFYRYGTAYGIEAGGLATLDVDNCTFYNLTKGIVLTSGSGNYTIHDSEFNEVFIGIETESVEQLIVTETDFYNYGVPEDLSTMGIFSKRTDKINLWDSRISSFKYGIRTTDVGHWTDIEMRECAEILNCGVGVYGYNVDFKMRNSSFFYNHFCVAGYDVFLDIPSNLGMNKFIHCVDANGNSGFTGTGPTVPPINHEVEQDMIRIFSSENSDLWGGHGRTGEYNETRGGEETGLEGERSGEVSGTGVSGDGQGNQGSNDGDGGSDPEISASPDPPYNGPEIVLPPWIDDEQECGFIFSIKNEEFQTNDRIPAENNYWVVESLEVGVHYYITQYDKAKFLSFEPLVLLPNIPTSGDCTIPGAGVAGGRFSDSSKNTNVYPNPAREKVTIELTQESQVLVTNLVGKVIYQSDHASTNHQIYCSTWTPGLYFLRLANGETLRVVKI